MILRNFQNSELKNILSQYLRIKTKNINLCKSIIRKKNLFLYKCICSNKIILKSYKPDENGNQSRNTCIPPTGVFLKLKYI